MSAWTKTFYTALGATLGAAVMYYKTQRNTPEFQEAIDELNEKAKQSCDSLRDWMRSDTSDT